MDSTKSIMKSARHFFSGTILSRISGAIRDIFMAFAFGTQESIAAFFVAFRLAHLLRRLFGEGALQAAFIPKFEKIRQKCPTRAARFFTGLYAALLLTLALIIAIGAAVLHTITPAFEEGSQNIITLTILMLPSLIFICLWGLNCSLLQCEKHYFLPSATPILFNAVWIFGALLIWSLQASSPMVWLAATIVLASAAQWLATVPKTLIILKNMGVLKPKLKNRDILAFIKPLFLGMLGVAAVQINSALDPLFARISSAEGPAFLWYAIRIQQLPLALFGIALSSALLPPLSRALEQGDAEKYRSFLKFCRNRAALVMVPSMLILICLGEWGISLVYGHGHFSGLSIIGTNLCLTGYALGLVPMALVLVYAPAFYAQGNYTTPSIASSISVIINIFLNALFILHFQLGPESVAAATSISAWGNAAILAVLYRHKCKSFKLDFVQKESF